MSLDLIPPETIIYTLKFSGPKTLRICQQVCRRLRQIVLNSHRLQYILELDICGYVEPSNPRKDLSYADKLDMLRATRNHWLYPNLIQPSIIELPISPARSPTYEFVDGVYVRGFRGLTSRSRLTRSLKFYQLPSQNKGTGYKHWCHEDLGFETRDFGICPEQNLLVLLEIVDIRVLPGHPEFEEHYRIHLRTMETNEPHPAASRSLGAILEYRLWASSYPDRSFYFQVLGHLLAIVFRSRERDLQSHIVIWDWTTGLKLAYLEIPGGRTTSFSFISEEYFVIPRNSKSHDLGESTPHDTLGRLDICRLHPTRRKILSYGDCCVASFMLPLLDIGQAESCLHLRSAPTPTSYSTKGVSTPKVYDVAPNNQLLCIDIRISSILNFPFDEAHGTLFVPSHALLAAISEQNSILTPTNDIPQFSWGEWAHHTSWVDTRGLRTNNERYMFGQRIAAFDIEPSLPGRGYNTVVLLDFDECRVRARRLATIGMEEEVHVPQPSIVQTDEGRFIDVPDIHDRSCGESFFTEASTPRRKYVKSSIILPPEYSEMCSSIMMDNEHVVVKTSGKAENLVLVYNF